MAGFRLELPLLVASIFALQWVPLSVHAGENAEGDTITLARCGITFSKPSNWFVAKPGMVEENIKKLDHEKESIDRILASSRGGIPLASFYKYDPRITPGVIPTINMLGMPNGTKTFDAFRSSINASSESLKSMLQNYVVKIPISERALAGQRVLWFSGEFDLSSGDGSTYKVSNTNYVLPCGKIFIQISMSEALPTTDNQAFVDFIGSFKPAQP